MNWLFSIFTSLITPLSSVINKWQDVRAKLAEMLHQKDMSELDAQMQSLLGEIHGESWLQRNWRPIAVLSLVAVVVYSIIHNAFLPGLYFWAQPIDIPPKVWDLIQLSLCGYMGLRTIEKLTGRR